MCTRQSNGCRTITTLLHPRSTFPFPRITFDLFGVFAREQARLTEILLSEEHSKHSDFGHEAPGFSEAWGYHQEVMTQVSN